MFPVFMFAWKLKELWKEIGNKKAQETQRMH